MPRRLLGRRALWALVLGGVLLNAVAFFHAWRFTHFVADDGRKTGSPDS